MSGQGQSNDDAAATTDTTYTKIFVGGLSWQTREEGLRYYFQQFGEIVQAIVVYEWPSGRSKGYGFVTFKEPEAAERACENSTPMIDGRRVDCRLAYLGAKGNNNNQVHQNGLSTVAPVSRPSSSVHQPCAPYFFAPHATHYFGPFPRYGRYQYIPMQFPMIYFNTNVNGVQPHMAYMYPYPFDGQNGFYQHGHAMQGLDAPQQQNDASFVRNADYDAQAWRTL